MPYSGASDPKLPKYVQELDTADKKKWVDIFNAVYAETGDEGEAMATASSRVNSKAQEELWRETIAGLEPVKLSRLQRFVKWFNGQPATPALPDYGFKVVGENQWIAWYTNAYQDRDKEFFPEDAIARDVKFMQENKSFPELWFYHIPGTKHGTGTWCDMVGRLAFAIGNFDPSPMAQAFKEYYKTHPAELSHGFIYDASKKINGAFYDYHTYEISTLPPGKAANPYTAFDVKEQTMPSKLSPDQFKSLQAIVGEDLALQIVQDGTQREKALQAAQVAYKAQSEANYTNVGSTITTSAINTQTPIVTTSAKGVTLEIETEAPEAEMETPMQAEDSAYTMKALCEKVDSLTKAMTDMVALMANKAVEPTPAPVVEEKTPPQLSDIRKATIIQDMLNNQANAPHERKSLEDTLIGFIVGGNNQ